jgi:hypothetical protein
VRDSMVPSLTLLVNMILTIATTSGCINVQISTTNAFKKNRFQVLVEDGARGASNLAPLW